jgi:hypothetical protein
MIFPDQPSSQRRRFAFMFFTVGSAYAIAMVRMGRACARVWMHGTRVTWRGLHGQLVSDVSVVLGIAGSTGSTAISFVLPPLFILKLSDAKLLSWQKVTVRPPLLPASCPTHATTNPSPHTSSPATAVDSFPPQISAMAMLALGVVFFVTSTVVTLLDASKAGADQSDLSNICNRTAANAS